MPEPRSQWIEVSSELLADLKQWSEPLQVKVERDNNGELLMIFRQPEVTDEQAPSTRAK